MAVTYRVIVTSSLDSDTYLNASGVTTTSGSTTMGDEYKVDVSVGVDPSVVYLISQSEYSVGSDSVTLF